MLGVLQRAKTAQVTLTADQLWPSRGQTWNCKQSKIWNPQLWGGFPPYAPCFCFCLKKKKRKHQPRIVCLLCFFFLWVMCPTKHFTQVSSVYRNKWVQSWLLNVERPSPRGGGLERSKRCRWTSLWGLADSPPEGKAGERTTWESVRTLVVIKSLKIHTNRQNCQGEKKRDLKI